MPIRSSSVMVGSMVIAVAHRTHRLLEIEFVSMCGKCVEIRHTDGRFFKAIYLAMRCAWMFTINGWG